MVFGLPQAALPYLHLLQEVQEVQQDQANQQDPEYHLYQQGLGVLFHPEEMKARMNCMYKYQCSDKQKCFRGFLGQIMVRYQIKYYKSGSVLEFALANMNPNIFRFLGFIVTTNKSSEKAIISEFNNRQFAQKTGSTHRSTFLSSRPWGSLRSWTSRGSSGTCGTSRTSLTR